MFLMSNDYFYGPTPPDLLEMVNKRLKEENLPVEIRCLVQGENLIPDISVRFPKAGGGRITDIETSEGVWTELMSTRTECHLDPGQSVTFWRGVGTIYKIQNISNPE